MNVFLFSFQQMDKQMDTTATWNVKGRVGYCETGRPGYS